MGSWPLWPWPLTFCMDTTSVNGNNSGKFQGDTMTGTLSKRCDRRKISGLRAAWSQLKKYCGHSSQNSLTFPYPKIFPDFLQNSLTLKNKFFPNSSLTSLIRFMDRNCVMHSSSPLPRSSPPPPLTSTGALLLHRRSPAPLLLHPHSPAPPLLSCSTAAPPLLSCSTAVLQAPGFGNLVLICHPNFIKDSLDIWLTSDQHWFEFGDPCSCIWFGEETSYYML